MTAQGHLSVTELEPIVAGHPHSQLFPPTHGDDTEVRVMHEVEAESKRLSGKCRGLRGLC